MYSVPVSCLVYGGSALAKRLSSLLSRTLSTREKFDGGAKFSEASPRSASADGLGKANCDLKKRAVTPSPPSPNHPFWLFAAPRLSVFCYKDVLSIPTGFHPSPSLRNTIVTVRCACFVSVNVHPIKLPSIEDAKAAGTASDETLATSDLRPD